MLFTILLAALLLVVPPTASARPANVTVDDTDPAVTWVGNWSQTPPGFGKPFNGTYRTAKDDPTAYAEFKFTGVAVYFVSSRWPYEASTRITLDPESPDAEPLLLRLEDYTTQTIHKDFGLAMVLAGATNLENKEHTVRVDVGPNEVYAVFDAFIYTTADSNSDPSSIESPGAFTALPSPLPVPSDLLNEAPTPSQVAASQKSGVNLAVIFGPICSVVAVVLVVAFYFFYRFKRQIKHSAKEKSIYDASRASSPDMQEKGMVSPPAPVFQLNLNKD